MIEAGNVDQATAIVVVTKAEVLRIEGLVGKVMAPDLGATYYESEQVHTEERHSKKDNDRFKEGK